VRWTAASFWRNSLWLTPPAVKPFSAALSRVKHMSSYKLINEGEKRVVYRWCHPRETKKARLKNKEKKGKK
jgi:hypothetical protein